MFVRPMADSRYSFTCALLLHVDRKQCVLEIFMVLSCRMDIFVSACTVCCCREELTIFKEFFILKNTLQGLHVKDTRTLKL